MVGREDRSGGDELGRDALPIGQVGLADLLADGDDDALPADQGAEPERNCDRELDPERDELGRAVEGPLVAIECRDVLLAKVGFLVLHQEADCFRREIHVVARVANDGAANKKWDFGTSRGSSRISCKSVPTVYVGFGALGRRSHHPTEGRFSGERDGPGLSRSTSSTSRCLHDAPVPVSMPNSGSPAVRQRSASELSSGPSLRFMRTVL
jgi:hypothetical protein